MINIDIITLNECKNDGSYIHLYYQDMTDTLIAYGLSAYALSRIFNENLSSGLSGFSATLLMPCVRIDRDILGELVRCRDIEKCGETDGIVLKLKEPVTKSNYMDWAKALREKYI